MMDSCDANKEMSLHAQSDSGFVESHALAMPVVRPRTVTAAAAAAADSSFYPAAAAASRKSASARRVVNRGRGGGTTDSLRSTAGTPTTARQSLLGRPVISRPNRRDARYRRCQVAVYNFLERPKNWRSILYHLLV